MNIIFHSKVDEHAKTATYNGHALLQLLPSSIISAMNGHFLRNSSLSSTTLSPNTLIRLLTELRLNWTRTRLRGGDAAFTSGLFDDAGPALFLVPATYFSRYSDAASCTNPSFESNLTASSLSGFSPTIVRTDAETQSRAISPAVNGKLRAATFWTT